MITRILLLLFIEFAPFATNTLFVPIIRKVPEGMSVSLFVYNDRDGNSIYSGLHELSPALWHQPPLMNRPVIFDCVTKCSGPTVIYDYGGAFGNSRHFLPPGEYFVSVAWWGSLSSCHLGILSTLVVPEGSHVVANYQIGAVEVPQHNCDNVLSQQQLANK